MQTHDDILPNSCLIGPSSHHLDLPTMHGSASSPIRSPQPPSPRAEPELENTHNTETAQNGNSATETRNEENGEKIDSTVKKAGERSSKGTHKESNNNAVVVRRERPSRACAVRSAKLYVDPPVIERRPRPPKKEKAVPAEAAEESEEEEEEGEERGKGQCGKIVTPLVNSPPPGQLPRWNLRAMWELASILNFLNIYRHLLKVPVDFSAEELESALITPNNTLSDIHIPLLKAIPPVTRMACGRDSWVTVLCRKLRDWWHWVADGDLPIVAGHGAETEHYRSLDPGVRVVILKALCDIRVEQDDIRSYIDDSMKRGISLSAFRKERIGGDSHGISYWYEDDPIIGHRLYREIRKVEVKRVKARGSNVLPNVTYDWETIATNFDEFQDVSEKLFTSKNRTEASLGKKLKNDMLPEIEKIHKRKERLLKKQQREALLLDNFGTMDGLVGGRSLRDRKPVTYTFDDYDRSINEAIKITKRKQLSLEVNNVKREGFARTEPSSNGRWHGPSHHASHEISFSPPSPPDYDDMDDDHNPQHLLDRSNRKRQRPQRYSENEFVEVLLDNDGDYFDSDDDIVGEVVYDEEYLRKRRLRKKLSSGSEPEGDEEYRWSEENGEEDEVEEEEEESFSMSNEEDSDGHQRQPHKFKGFSKTSGRSRRESKAKLRSVEEIQAGLRRSKRSKRSRINYRQYEFSESDHEPSKPRKPPNNAFQSNFDTSENEDFSRDSQGSGEGSDERGEEGRSDGLAAAAVEDDGYPIVVENDRDQGGDPNESCKVNPDWVVGKERRFLDLNELAPGSGFDDGPSASMKADDDENKDKSSADS